MSLNEVQLFVSELEVGMYVSALDKPWSETPFPLQGFMLQSQSDIEQVRELCNYVFIDIHKGAPANVAISSSPYARAIDGDQLKKPSTVKPSFPIKPNVYTTTVPVSREIPVANKTIENLVGALSHVLRQVERNGPLDHEQLEVAADAMVDSVVRCPNAFHWLMKLRGKDAQSHDHSLRSALWAVQFGRHIGLDKNQLQDICLAALLKRVGILHLDTALVRNTARSAEEEKEYHRFVVLGVAHLQKSGFKNQRVLNIIKYHCERYDGSGYPVGLSGVKIPFLSSVIGIAGEFDAWCNPNTGGRTISASKATSHLYETRQKLFSEDLVVEFIRSIGLYPPGTVVELSTGDCAMVVEQDPRARLTPKIAVFDSVSEFTSSTNYVLVDLKHEQLARQKLSGFGRRQGFSVARLSIVKDIDAQKFTVDQSLLPALLSQSFDKVLDSAESKSDQGGFFSSLAKRLGR